MIWRNMEQTLPTEPQEESIPKSLVPWNRDDDRSRYLGLRSSGFTLREALGLIGKAKSTLSLWRKDPKFLELEDKLPELRKTLGLEYAIFEFFRNYRLVMEKDNRVLKSSLMKRTTRDKDGNEVEVPMDAQDFKYLLQMRSHYTPQQLLAFEQLASKGNDAGRLSDDWVEIALRMTRTTEEVRIETRQRQEPNLARIVEVESDGPKTDNS